MKNNEFADILVCIRGSLGLTQEELAEKLGVSKRSISLWENGDGFPKKTLRIKLAVISNLPLKSFLLDEELSSPIDNDPEKQLQDKLNEAVLQSGLSDSTQQKYIQAIRNAYDLKNY